MKRKPSPVCSRLGRVSLHFQHVDFYGCFWPRCMQPRLIWQPLRSHLTTGHIAIATANRLLHSHPPFSSTVGQTQRTAFLYSPVLWVRESKQACGLRRQHGATFVPRIYKQECDLYPHGTNFVPRIYKQECDLYRHGTTCVPRIYKQECDLYRHGTNLYLGFTSRNVICTRTVQICTSDLQAGM